VPEGTAEYEHDIVWKEDPGLFRFVREKWVTTDSRTDEVPTRFVPGRYVGYATLRPDAPTTGDPGQYSRRVFYLEKHDAPVGGDSFTDGLPAEGVDPLTVEAGSVGEVTPRARGE
jgi:hypothetical protein